jgi:hypothetical protein
VTETVPETVTHIVMALRNQNPSALEEVEEGSENGSDKETNNETKVKLRGEYEKQLQLQEFTSGKTKIFKI